MRKTCDSNIILIMKKPILTVIKRAIAQELFKVDKTPLEILKEVPDITALKLEAFFYPLGIYIKIRFMMDIS